MAVYKYIYEYIHWDRQIVYWFLKGLSQKINMFLPDQAKLFWKPFTKTSISWNYPLNNKEEPWLFNGCFHYLKVHEMLLIFYCGSVFPPFFTFGHPANVHILFWIYVLNTQKTLCIYISILSVIFLPAYERRITMHTDTVYLFITFSSHVWMGEKIIICVLPFRNHM